MLEKNTRIDTLVSLLGAKTRIAIWASETENLFDGCVYQLYDNKDFGSMFITYLRLDSISGVTVIASKEWQK